MCQSQESQGSRAGLAGGASLWDFLWFFQSAKGSASSSRDGPFQEGKPPPHNHRPLIQDWLVSQDVSDSSSAPESCSQASSSTKTRNAPRCHTAAGPGEGPKQWGLWVCVCWETSWEGDMKMI